MNGLALLSKDTPCFFWSKSRTMGGAWSYSRQSASKELRRMEFRHHWRTLYGFPPKSHAHSIPYLITWFSCRSKNYPVRRITRSQLLRHNNGRTYYSFNKTKGCSVKICNVISKIRVYRFNCSGKWGTDCCMIQITHKHNVFTYPLKG